jgi:hypothetical protein
VRIIYKYPIQVLGPTPIPVPLDSRVLSAQLQGDVCVAWVEQHDMELGRTFETVVVQCVMTGHPTSDNLTNWTFLDTIQTRAGLVIHVYYRKVES